MTMKKNNPGCCTCGGTPTCTCTAVTCWIPYNGEVDGVVPHALTCKCLNTTKCPDDLTDISLDIVGSGTPLNDPISCDTVACNWTGTFVLSCGNGGLDYVEFVKFTFICEDATKKYYYKHTLRCNYNAVGVFIKTVTNRATFGLQVTMLGGVYSFSKLIFGQTYPDGTWGSEGGTSEHIAGYTDAIVVHSFTGNLLEFRRNETDETNCPTDPCNPVGELVQCGTAFTHAVAVDTPGQGCYPDPDYVILSPSWP